MFLYGPPGTSKTSVAEGLAGRLDLKLVTINVSDFIMLGVEAVEQRAKIIFDVLGELKNIVVLFDEIDRLITDRDSDRYLEQGDILQLMTPSMLTKLNDLRRKRKLLFVVSTNYFERIDRAIRRPGRIDQHFLISPFDQKSRVALLQNFICKFKGLGEKGKDWEFPSNAEMRLNSIAKLAPLLVFEELKGVFDRSTSGLGKGDIKGLLQNLESEIHKVNPSINLESYKRKFAEMRLDPEPPFMEFFFLCFLLAEVDQADSEIRRLFQEQWEEWKEKNAPEAREFTSDEWVKEQLKRLTKSQNKRGKESTKRAGKEE
jgi:SpoVK/Ycf46/Vps4 family AAA+-type ATPase